MTVSKNKISFDRINKEIEQMDKPKSNATRLIIDGQGILHVFPTHRDYLAYLDERDLELIGSKS